jgi:acyl-ACP thioesterase
VSDDGFVPLPARGRRFVATRTIRLGDAGLDGRLRLDALARFLQDVAADDAHEVGLRAASWVVRRTALAIDGRPSFGDRVELTTFCGGIGSRWAERRTTVTGPGVRIESSALWVFLDPDTGRPAALPQTFLDAYGEASGGRTVSSRLTLAPPPADESGLTRRPWPLRATDFDVLGHVNNAVYWSVIEDDPVSDGTAELEYRLPIEPDTAPVLVGSADGRRRWLVSDAGVHAAVVVRSRSSATEASTTSSPASRSTSPGL